MCFEGIVKLKGVLSCVGISFVGKFFHAGRRRFKYNIKQEFESRSMKSKEALQCDNLEDMTVIQIS